MSKKKSLVGELVGIIDGDDIYLLGIIVEDDFKHVAVKWLHYYGEAGEVFGWDRVIHEEVKRGFLRDKVIQEYIPAVKKMLES
jgi:hypothetical protein